VRFDFWLSLEELYYDYHDAEEIEDEGGGPCFLALANIMLSCSCRRGSANFEDASDYAEAQRRLKEEYMSHKDHTFATSELFDEREVRAIAAVGERVWVVAGWRWNRDTNGRN